MEFKRPRKMYGSNSKKVKEYQWSVEVDKPEKAIRQMEKSLVEKG